ncbi:hypothetical protein GCM10010151_62350 [Actinoallomurus spadix]|uniref:Uncharacterized protein n=1 Tax=Actinoallomurus spadix TaxID=79912 RepID=A0ABN0XHF6_9ACTN
MAVERLEVRAADPGCRDPHEDLTAAGRLNPYLGQVHRDAELPDHRRACHPFSRHGGDVNTKHLLGRVTAEMVRFRIQLGIEVGRPGSERGERATGTAPGVTPPAKEVP